jgi:hypothetical protein
MKKWFESPLHKIKMRQNENVCVAFAASQIALEFSHRLALEPAATAP